MNIDMTNSPPDPTDDYRWLCVNNLLPEPGAWVIAAMVKDDGLHVNACKYDGAGIFRVGNHYPLVTHWMPMPAPPVQ